MIFSQFDAKNLTTSNLKDATVHNYCLQSLVSDENKSKSTQPTAVGGVFKTHQKKTKQQELEEKIAFLEGKMNELSQSPERSQFTLSGLPSGVGSANKLAQEDSHIQCKEIMTAKDKQISEFKEDKNRLQEKLEIKDAELLQLRTSNLTLQGENGRLFGELLGLNVIKSLLKDKEDEIKKLNTELIQAKKGSPINLHRQCEQTIRLLEFDVELLKKERDKYRNHRDDLAGVVSKRVVAAMEKHMNISESSIQLDNFHSQDNYDSSVVHTEDENSDKDVKISGTTHKCDKKQRKEDDEPKISRQNQSKPGEVFKTKIFKLVPLKNRGNTCYLNAALQVLQILSWFDCNKNLFDKDEGLDLYKRFYHQEQGFNYSVQRDSAETFLLGAARLGLQQNFSSRTLLSVTCKECNNIVEVLDDGILNLQVKNTLENAFQVFSQETDDLQDYVCTNSSCSKIGTCFKKRITTKFGKSVLIQYRRFHYKIDTQESFKLSDTIKSDNIIVCPTTKLQYELVAYVNHIGDLPNSGHYTAYVKQNSVWYMCDDDKIYIMTDGQEIQQWGQAYYLLYAKLGQTNQNSFRATQQPLGYNTNDTLSNNKTLGKRRYSIMRKNKDGWVDVTQAFQQNNLIKIDMEQFRYRCVTCKKLLSCEFGWRKHTEWMILCGRNCTCDVFSFAKYSHSLIGTSTKKVQRKIQAKELTKLEDLIERTMKKPELIEPEKFKSILDTKRDVQREESIAFANQTKNQLMAVEGWLTSISQQCEKNELKAIGAPICDGIVYPRCPLIFGSDLKKHDHDLMLFLKSHGIAVRTVGNTAKSDPTVAFVYLLDSDNEYTTDLMLKLQQSLDDLAQKIQEAVPHSGLQKSIETELSNLYIRQTDYTKDYLSFFIVKSLNKNFDVLRQIGDKIGIPFSETHSQLFSSIQFQSFVEDASGKQVRAQRLKAYNKWVYLLLTTSFKAALSMGTSKLFKGPAVFHMNKLQPSFSDGLFRLELSSYYYSIDQWKIEALQLQKWSQTIDRMECVLQEVEEQLIFKVSLKVFWESFWFSVDAATTIIDFQADLWTVVYAYSQRSYLFTGHHTDKHAKSGAQLTFLQRFAGAKTLTRVRNGQKTKQFLINRHGHSRQIPIGSLNVKQVEENRMPIDMAKWFYHLSKGQLDQIYFTCDNQEEFDEWFGQDPALVRSNVSELENEIDHYAHQNDIHQLNQKIKTSPQQSNKTMGQVDTKKREVKLSDKREIKQQKQAIPASKSAIGKHFIVKNGSKRGKQQWVCKLCRNHYTTDDTTKPNYDSPCSVV